MFQILSAEAQALALLTLDFLMHSKNKKTACVAYQSDYHISPPNPWTRAHQIQNQTPKFPTHPYQCSCLFLKIFQHHIIIMLCRSEAALSQDEWNKSEIWVLARSRSWKLCVFCSRKVRLFHLKSISQFRLFIFNSEALKKDTQHHILTLFSGMTVV